MNKKRRLLQSDTFCGLAAGVLVLLQFWWLPGEDGSAADSYSTTIDGKLAFFRTLTELFSNVERDSLNVTPETTATLLIVGPDRYPSELESQQLCQFVYGGGRLLFAPNWSAPKFSLPGLGIELTERLPTENATTSFLTVPRATPTLQPSAAADARPGSGEFLPEASSGSIDDAGGVDGSVRFRGTAQLIPPSQLSAENLLESPNGVIEAATWPMGHGRVVVCSSPDTFSNRSMLYKNSRRLAVRLVERCVAHESEGSAAHSDLIVLSEYFNASDAYQHTGILFSPTLRIGTLQLLLVAVLGIWLAFHRFGPATEVTTRQRRSLTESAQAVGNLQYRLSDGGAVVQCYLEYMRSQLRRRYGSFLRLDDPDAIANRSGLVRTDVSDRLREAHAMAKSAQLSSAKTAAMLRWLSTLNQRLTGTTESRKPKAESG